MKDFLNSLKTIRDKKQSHFFYIAFDEPTDIYCTRGLTTNTNMTQYLLENRIGDIAAHF
jgi:hypothetical protein